MELVPVSFFNDSIFVFKNQLKSFAKNIKDDFSKIEKSSFHYHPVYLMIMKRINKN